MGRPTAAKARAAKPPAAKAAPLRTSKPEEEHKLRSPPAKAVKQEVSTPEPRRDKPSPPTSESPPKAPPNKKAKGPVVAEEEPCVVMAREAGWHLQLAECANN